MDGRTQQRAHVHVSCRALGGGAVVRGSGRRKRRGVPWRIAIWFLVRAGAVRKARVGRVRRVGRSAGERRGSGRRRDEVGGRRGSIGVRARAEFAAGIYNDISVAISCTSTAITCTTIAPCTCSRTVEGKGRVGVSCGRRRERMGIGSWVRGRRDSEW